MNFKKLVNGLFSQEIPKPQGPKIPSDPWERIGIDTDDAVPSWVRKEIDRIYRTKSGNAPLRRYELKGRRYRYRLEPKDEGPARYYVVHRKRRGRSKKSGRPMRRVAWCLVEDDGRILMVQRAYGSKKGKWSLPGGYVDKGESRRRAAYRETKEETGIVVKITHRLFTSSNRASAVFVGRRIGGRLRYQQSECLDVRWRDPSKIESFELAFGGDHKALKLWRDIKAGRATPEETYYTG